MDKFTVDLDQVLNDFEYSELTDQYNNSAKFTDNNPAVVQSNNVSKHSINNVFHSLNEYLNTNISNLETVDNNVIDDSERHYLNSNEKEVSVIEEKAHSGIPHINKIQGEIKEEFNIPLFENTEEFINIEDISKIDSFHSYNTNNKELKIPDSFNNDSILESVEVTSDNAILKFEKQENNIDLHTELQNVVGDNFGNNYDKKLPIDSQELKTVVGFDQSLHFDDQEINKLLSELEEDDEINIDINESQLSISNGGCEIADNDNITYDKGKSFDSFFMFYSIRFKFILKLCLSIRYLFQIYL